MCAILSDLWSLFSRAKLEGTKLEALSYCPSEELLQQFWKLCEYRLSAPGGCCSVLLVPPLNMSYLIGVLLFGMPQLVHVENGHPNY